MRFYISLETVLYCSVISLLSIIINFIIFIKLGYLLLIVIQYKIKNWKYFYRKNSLIIILTIYFYHQSLNLLWEWTLLIFIQKRLNLSFIWYNYRVRVMDLKLTMKATNFYLMVNLFNMYLEVFTISVHQEPIGVIDWEKWELVVSMLCQRKFTLFVFNN